MSQFQEVLYTVMDTRWHSPLFCWPLLFKTLNEQLARNLEYAVKEVNVIESENARSERKWILKKPPKCVPVCNLHEVAFE